MPRLRDIAGKIWTSPNTALGLAYGGLGMLAGAIGWRLGFQARPPRVRWRGNAFQFTDNPFGGVGALTLGNTITWIGDPYDREDRIWRHADGRPRCENGHGYPEHEHQHTVQAQHLGPFYLPSNLLGGLAGLLLDRNWHGPHNWNERGPQADPPRPWMSRRGAERR